MKKKDYIQALTDEDKIHIEFSEDRGKILRFVVQYLSLIDSRWRIIMRVDNCHHGERPHKHTYYLKSKKTFTYLGDDVNIVFTEAKQNIVKNFRKIRDNFLTTR